MQLRDNTESPCSNSWPLGVQKPVRTSKITRLKRPYLVRTFIASFQSSPFLKPFSGSDMKGGHKTSNLWVFGLVGDQTGLCYGWVRSQPDKHPIGL